MKNMKRVREIWWRNRHRYERWTKRISFMSKSKPTGKRQIEWVSCVSELCEWKRRFQLQKNITSRCSVARTILTIYSINYMKVKYLNRPRAFCVSHFRHKWMISASYESKLFIERNNLQVKSTRKWLAPSQFLLASNRSGVKSLGVRIWNEHAILARKKCVETI